MFNPIQVKLSKMWRASLLLLLLCSTPLNAGPFSVGSKSLSIVVGNGQAFNQNYTIIGAGFGYYVMDGLQVSLEAQTWTGNDPSITKVSPGIQYVYDQGAGLKPYVGAFFTRTSVDGFEDIDSAGGRLGAVLSSQDSYYISAGIVYESYLDCESTPFVECDDTYPEFNLVFLL